MPERLESIQIGNDKIDRARCVKYIGLYMDEKLNWEHHVTETIKTMTKYFGIFNKIKHSISAKFARQIYFSFVYSHIKYAIEVYGACSENLMNKLQIIQNKLVKLLLKLDWRTSTKYLHKHLNILKVCDIYKVSLLEFVHACKYRETPPTFYTYFSTAQTSYRTRQQGHLRVVNTNKSIGDTRVQCHAARLWNAIDNETQNIETKETFKKNVSKMIIQSYN